MPTLTKATKTALAAAATLTLAVAGIVAGWQLTLPDADHLTRTADTFVAPPEWGKAIVTAEPARIVCLGGNACPSTHRRWVVPAETTLEDFRAVLDTTGWALDYSKGCTTPPPENGNSRICSASGDVDGVAVRAFYESAQPEGAHVGTVAISARYP